MVNGLWICLLTAFLHISFTSADTNSQDAAALASLRNMWQSTPRSWQGSDPCGSQWDGITCKNSRIIYIQLSSIGLKGSLTGDILSLTELQILQQSINRRLWISMRWSLVLITQAQGKVMVILLSFIIAFNTLNWP